MFNQDFKRFSTKLSRLISYSILLLALPSACSATSTLSNKGVESEFKGVFECVTTEGQYHSYDYPNIASGIPCNVDMSAISQAKTNYQKQRYFDIYSWQTFIALFWPTLKDGLELAPNLTDTGTPRWDYWKESYQVYQSDGSKPVPWNNDSVLPSICINQDEVDTSRKMLYRTNKVVNMSNTMTVADEIDQAFTYPLVDQQNNIVRYEVLMNKAEFDYLVKHELYNIDGQIDFSKGGQSVDFPSGDNSSLSTGAIELKLAWKVLTPTTPKDRYFTFEAIVLENNKRCVEVDVGLVGMHISHKTEDNKQWVWSTFEHIDNVRTNSLHTVVYRNGDTGELLPSFNNPNCPSCPVNILPPKDQNGLQPPTQVTRVIAIDKNTELLNREVQNQLASEKSILQYYELIGTQFPTDESALPATPNQFDNPDDPALTQIDNKPGGKPFPVFLINTTMETYMQKGNQPAQLQIQGFPFNDTPSFGTESCMGCHYSAGVAVDTLQDSYGQKQVIYGPATSADFSWLLQLKAQFKSTSTN